MLLLLVGAQQASNAGPPPPPPAPTLSFIATATSVQQGQGALLIWSTSNATSCVASGGWSGTQPTSGSVSTGALLQTTSFTLTATGVAGAITQTITIAVNIPTPVDDLQAQMLTRLQRLIPNGWF